MRWTLRNQILVPFSLLLLAAVTITAAVAAGMAARRSDQERVRQLRSVLQTLGDARFPLKPSVLEKMRGLSGAEFVARDAGGGVVATTFAVAPSQPMPRDVPTADSVARLTEFPVVEIDGGRYFVAQVPADGVTGVASLLVFYPVANWQRARWDAAWPPLAVAAAMALLTLATSAWLAHRLAARIGVVHGMLARLAAQDYLEVPATPPRDEVYDLQLAANQLSRRLAMLEEGVRRTERLHLLGQLAGGLAHQLRNAVTGARMAVQLHQRRCRPNADDESLDIALRQMTLTEEQIKGLLSLGAPRENPQQSAPVKRIVADVAKLLEPVWRHAKVECRVDTAAVEDIAVDNAEGVRASLLNLALNGIEAAGVGGKLWIRCELDEPAGSSPKRVVLRVIDTGAGPPESVRETLFDPFVTTKPEGVGLGLMLAQQTAANGGGSLTWTRNNGCTEFCLTLPAV